MNDLPAAWFEPTSSGQDTCQRQGPCHLCCPSSFSLTLSDGMLISLERETFDLSICSAKPVTVSINFCFINPFLQVLLSGNIAWPTQQLSAHTALAQLFHHLSSSTHYPPQNFPSSDTTVCHAEIELPILRAKMQVTTNSYTFLPAH